MVKTNLSNPLKELEAFFKKITRMESKTELITSIGLYVMLTLVSTSLLDKYSDIVFEHVENIFPFINPSNKIWIFIQVTLQLFLSIVISYVIRKITNNLVLPVGKHMNPGFGMFDKSKAGTIIFAFILFFAQANLKEKLKALVPEF